MSDTFDRTPPHISTSRLGLRALAPEDSAAVYAYAFDPEVAKYMPWRAGSSELFAAGLVSVVTQPQFMNWAITLPPRDTAVGMIFLHSFSRQHRKAEIAFNLSRAHWRRGIATEAATAVMEFGFGQLGLNRIEALCMPENSASATLLRKLGMTVEGTMRKVHHRYDGYQDMLLFALLATERGQAQPR
jgi:[ribosomal protein S5]-alanine N-acetyltransferase